MIRRLFPILGVVAIATAVYVGLRESRYEATTTFPTGQLSADEASDGGARGGFGADGVRSRIGIDADLEIQLRSARPADAMPLMDRYGSLAPRAYAALGDAGIEMLPVTRRMPNAAVYLESDIALIAAPATQAVSGYIRDLVEHDPAAADAVFHTLTRLGRREAGIAAENPRALPILAVAPSPTTAVVERYGDRAIDFMLRFEPDGYPAIARLLEADGERVFAVQDRIAALGDDLVATNRVALDRFLTTYFIEFGSYTPWIEREMGLETSLFFLSNNVEYLRSALMRHGDTVLRSSLQSLKAYAESHTTGRQEIAQMCVQVPGAFPLFVELRQNAAIRDRFLSSYAVRGGAALMQAFDTPLWQPLVAAIDTQGESALVTLGMLESNDRFHDMLSRVLRTQPDGLDLAGALRAMTAALADDGGPSAGVLPMVTRTLGMIMNGDIEDIPDDYLSRQVHWLWDVLPGRDAFRLARMMIRGYSPTLMEQVNGVWDGVNVVTFAYRSGTAVVNCTRSIAAAVGQESFSGLAEALGVVGREAAGNVFARLKEAISEPKNYIRLALTTGYFAYDGILRYAPFDIPNRDALLAFNQKHLDARMRDSFFALVRNVGLRALVWRPEFDDRDWVPTPPGVLQQIGELSEQGRVALELDKLDYEIKMAMVHLLNQNERRRQFMKLLQGGGGSLRSLQELFGGDGEESAPDGSNPRTWRFDDLPNRPDAEGEQRPGTPNGDREERDEDSGEPQDDLPRYNNPDQGEQIGYWVVDNERRPFRTISLVSWQPQTHTSEAGAWTLAIDNRVDSWSDTARNPRLTAHALAWIGEMGREIE